MHELSLCRSLLKILKSELTRLTPAKQVTAIWLEVGALSAVDISSLQFYFPLIAKNTFAEKARLHIVTVPAQATCLACKQAVTLENFAPCPFCQSYNLEIHQGKELIVKKMEVR